MFGTDFDKIFDSKVDKTYSSFLNFPKKNRLFKEALISSIENIYRNLDEQREFDSIASVLKTEAVYTPDTSDNSIYIRGTGTPIVTEYEHLLTVKSKFIQDTFWDITAVERQPNSPFNTTITISTARNNLRDKDYVQISGLVGIPAVNGLRYLKKINSTKFQLFSDKDLQTPVVITVPSQSYTSGGDIYRVWYEYCKPYFSDRKIGVFGKPTVDLPKYELSENKLILYPLDETCSEITIDYITNNLVLIDPEDIAIDLELTYPSNFLYTVAKEASKLFAESIKDMELLQTANLELQEEK